MTMRLRTLLPALMVSLGILAADPAISFSATIVIVNMDGAGEGFNDPTAAAPVGGNPGVTIGQQRLNVFQEAANIWGAILPSAITIRVQAAFNPLSCTPTSAVLGSAGPINLAGNFGGAEFLNTWYHIALANKLAGADLDGGVANDINAQFNSNLGQAGCLTGSFFYYGFDHNEGGNIDLLAVVLHELGHGLGFSSVANLTTGAFPSGFPGVYDRFLLDNSNGLHWHQMNNAQRVASSVNFGNLVWDGTAVTVKSSSFMNRRPQVVVNSPPAIAGTYRSGSASFGTPLNVAGFSGDVVLGVDGSAPANDGCSALTNAGAINGNIALLDRGNCAFNIKAANAMAAGATGVIIANNVAGLAHDMGGVDGSITIPVASVSLADGNAIKAELGGGVNATLALSTVHLAGADDSHRMLMYAPNPVQPGSSVSHWDVTATPNFLMEPAINSDLTNVDMTTYLFEDIGWLPRTTSVPQSPPAASVMRLGLSSPNPFGTATRIDFSVARPMSVSVDVIDMGGRLVRRLMSEPLAVGDQSTSWDGTDADGRRVAPGVYLFRLRAGSETQSRRVALVR